MSKLYIRVRTGFYSHRKTARLRAVIGDDAFWIPPRLWAYCAENQPDGDLSGYQNPEISELLGCQKYATSILQALLEAGFLDASGKVHGWEEHNGYHQTYSQRAKVAAAARWSKEKPPTPPKEDNGNRKGDIGDKQCFADAYSIIESGEAKASAQRSKFKKPTIEEIKLAAAKAGLAEIEADRFFNYYESNGWRVGRNPMKSWIHALTNWKNNLQIYGNTKHNGTNNLRPDRSIGTLNEGTAAQYRGIKSRG